MDDKEILHHITELVNEEHELMNLAEGTGLDDEQQARVKALEISLDQCWDLLRQRRPNPCRSRCGPTGSWFPRCLSAGTRAGQSGCGLRKG